MTTEIRAAIDDATLYELAAAYVATLEENEGEVTLDLSLLDAAIDRKAYNYQRMAHHLRAKAAGVRGELAYYKALIAKREAIAKKLDAEVDDMETRLIDKMIETGKHVIESVLGALKIKRSPHIELAPGVDLKDVPEVYIRNKPELDKSELRKQYMTIYKAIRAGSTKEQKSDAQCEAEAQAKMPKSISVVYDKTLGGF